MFIFIIVQDANIIYVKNANLKKNPEIFINFLHIGIIIH